VNWSAAPRGDRRSRGCARALFYVDLEAGKTLADAPLRTIDAISVPAAPLMRSPRGGATEVEKNGRKIKFAAACGLGGFLGDRPGQPRGRPNRPIPVG
jgi:hypothetical protein